MQKFRFLCVVIIMFLVLCSCMKGEKMSFTVSDSNENIINLVTTIYSNDQLDEIKNNNNDIKQLALKYPIQCLRKKDSYYQVIYRGDEKILISVFNIDGNKILSQIYNTSEVSSTFDVLSVGYNIDEVQKVDPLGDYTFLYTGRNDVPHISYHYTNDGYIIQITYNDENIITDIDKKLI